MSVLPSQPAVELRPADKLLDVLGSFWSSVYQGQDLVMSLLSSKAKLAAQTNFKLLELLNSMSRFSVPVYSRENWTSLVIRQSQLKSVVRPRLRYGDGSAFYGISTVLYFDEYALSWSDSLLGWGPAGSNYGDTVTVDTLDITKPSALVHAPLLLNAMLKPSVTLVPGIDYRLQGDVIVFKKNPFDNPLISQLELVDAEGNVVDKELVLWIYNGHWDRQTTYKQFGYALNFFARSSENYKQLVNAILDACCSGTSVKSQQLALAAISGYPFVKEAAETVESIITTSAKLQIVTDRHVYTYSADSQPLVAVGDVVNVGDFLTNDIQVYELNRGSENFLNDFRWLTLHTSLLSSSYFSGLTFENKEVPIEITVADDGRLELSWEILGFPPDVAAFWAEVRAREVSEGYSLVDLLDTRQNQEFPATASNMPSTINPLQFLIDNVLRNNMWVVKLRQASQPFLGVGGVSWNQLRRIQPPHTCLLLVQEVEFTEDPISPIDMATGDGDWYTENLGSFTPVAAVEEIGHDVVSESADVYYTESICGDFL